MKLGARFNLTVGVAVISIMGISGAWSAISLSRTLHSDLVKNSQVAALRLSQNASKALWDMDEQAVELAIRTEMLDTEILHALVFDANNKIVRHIARIGSELTVESGPEPTNSMLVSGEHAVELEKGDEKKNLGKAKVFYSQKKMQSEITSQILGTLLQTAILSLIILIVTAFALTRTVLKPVQKATKIIQNFAAGEFNTHSEFDKKNGDDEISTMVQMLTTLGTFLRSRAENAAALSEGNLLIQVQLASERDIMGREFEKMVQGLTEKVKTIRSCANTVLEDGNQISKATEELSQNAVRQAAALEEISSTLTEIDAKTKENSKNATALAESARESTQVATTGNERAQELASALAEIANAGKKVTGIVKIIDDIAFQTNLLALNAAVEAARAGKHGKGFAVVADEVRNLATRSAEAVAQTTTVIAKMQESTKQGSAVSSKLNDVILNILANAQSVHATANNVAAASEQQASSITQVTTGIHQIEGAVQQSAASTEEVGSTTAMLRQEMNRLASSVSAFRID